MKYYKNKLFYMCIMKGEIWVRFNVLSNKKYDGFRIINLNNKKLRFSEREGYYKMSRGIIVKNILFVDDAVNYIHLFDFKDIEPFTLVLVDWNIGLKSYKLVWDGTKKHFKKLTQEPKIWSSSTLYTHKMKELRKDWFADWLATNDQFTKDKILSFHKNERLGSPDISPKMKRKFIETVSITAVEKRDENIEMSYYDFL